MAYCLGFELAGAQGECGMNKGTFLGVYAGSSIIHFSLLPVQLHAYPELLSKKRLLQEKHIYIAGYLKDMPLLGA